MARGKTFNLGDFMVNVSDKGIATKNMNTGEIRRYKYPWVSFSEKLAEKNAAANGEYDSGYDAGAEGEYEEEYSEYEESRDYEYGEPSYRASDSEYYSAEDDEDYEDEDQQPETLLDNPILMWAALVLLPPLGIWLLWRNNRFEIVTRSVISAASLLWFIILLFWLFSFFRRGGEDIQMPPTGTSTPTIAASVTPTISPTPTAIPQNTPTPTPSPTPSATPQTGNMGNTTVATTNAPEYVWSKEGGTWYHKDQNCTNMQGAARVTLAIALNRRQTACPTCFPAETVTKPTATPLPSGKYYSTPNGSNYHVEPNCRNMTNAQVVTIAEALARGQTPCETCIGSVYMTDGGSNYHSNSSCRGMKNAYLTTIEKAIAAGKTACTTCMDGASVGNVGTNTNPNTNTGNTGTTDKVYYYNPNGGTYYHTTATCTGMKNAIKGTAAAAENNGLKPCPTCLGGVSTNAKYWATTNGENYHSEPNCRGMRNAVRITEATAIARGKTPCTTCIGTTTGGTIVEVKPGGTTGGTVTAPTTTTKYYSTVDGENFHSNQTCRGMVGATEVTAAQIIERGQTACPRCIGTSGTYYSTPTGENYHSNPTCRGMDGATIVTLAMINARNQTPCERCIGTTGGNNNANNNNNNDNANVTYYWATAQGANYHSKSNCRGMRNATKITEENAEARGQTPCPECLGSVYGTDDGTWYHKDKTCMGMANAKHMTILAAEKSGKTACPRCIGGAAAATPTPKPTATPKPTVTPKPGEDDNDGGLYYYSCVGGTWYHRISNCQRMENPDKVSEATAVARGQKPCPTCIGSVYATDDGDHYHSNPTCSGMRNAKLVTVDTAELRGQSPCPECLDGDHDAPVEEETDAAKITVYCTLTGRYYHSYQYCSDMKHAGPVTLAWALSPKYTPCTKCGAPAAKDVDNPDEYMVYCALGGANYHTKKNCSGMRSAADVPLSWALNPGFRPCRDCDPPTL